MRRMAGPKVPGPAEAVNEVRQTAGLIIWRVRRCHDPALPYRGWTTSQPSSARRGVRDPEMRIWVRGTAEFFTGNWLKLPANRRSFARISKCPCEHYDDGRALRT